MRLLADLHVSRAIVAGLLQEFPGLDILHAYDAGLDAEPDERLLEYAARENRVLITWDKASIPPLIYDRLNHNEHFAGAFILTQQMTPGRAIRVLVAALRPFRQHDLENQPPVYLK